MNNIIRKYKKGHCNKCESEIIWTNNPKKENLIVRCSNYNCINHKELEIEKESKPEYHKA